MGDLADELERLAKLYEAGILDDEELKAAKARLLHAPAPSAMAQPQWEYKEVVIPLNFQGKYSCPSEMTESALFKRGAELYAENASPLILRTLQKEGQAGWQPAEPADLLSLYLGGHVRMRCSFWGGAFLRSKVQFEKATIRLRRLVS